MYLYKVYLHCQECLGTERLQFLAARSSPRGQDLKWLPSGLLKCRRPAASPGPRAALRPGRGLQAVSREARERPSRINTSWYYHFSSLSLSLFFFKLLEKLTTKQFWNRPSEKVVTRGLFRSFTHLNFSVTHMPAMLSANERKLSHFCGRRGKGKTSPPYGNLLQ